MGWGAGEGVGGGGGGWGREFAGEVDCCREEGEGHGGGGYGLLGGDDLGEDESK